MSAFADWWALPSTCSDIDYWTDRQREYEQVARAAWLAALEEAKRRMPERYGDDDENYKFGWNEYGRSMSDRLSALIEASKEPA